MKKSLFLSSMLLGNAVFSAQVFELDTYQRISAVVALDEPNRITVENDKIQQVYGDDGRYIIQGDELNGHVFIRPNSDNQTPFSITLITQTGLTQDLLLTPKMRNARTIIIRSKLESNKTKTSCSLEGQIIALNQAMWEEKDLSGFTINKNIELKHQIAGLHWQASIQYLGEQLEGLVLEVTNYGKQTLSLSPNWFKDSNTLAAAICEQELSPQASTKVLLVRKV